jgi:hypothetical protein
MELNPDFQEFLRSFVGHDVRFLIVGGYALAAHGHPRYTKDLDVWVWTDPLNVERRTSNGACSRISSDAVVVMSDGPVRSPAAIRRTQPWRGPFVPTW